MADDRSVPDEPELRQPQAAEPDEFDSVDIAMVHADDEYLDALATAYGDPADRPESLADDELSRLLLAWREEVDSEPIGELVDTKLAVATVRAARARHRRRPRLLVPVAAAAAVLAIAFAGVGLAARDAQPGDTLWALTEVLYADHARSVEAAAAVRTELADAQQALAEGRVAEARSSLNKAEEVLPSVRSEDGQADLEAQHASLVAQLPGGSSDGAEPPPSADPTTAPVTDTDSSTSTSPSPGDSDTDTSPSPSTPPSSSSSPPTTSSSSEPQSGTREGETGGSTEGAPAAEVPQGSTETVDAPPAGGE